MRQKSYDTTPTLYIIPTPIGNMLDITYRAVEVLKMVDIIFCEDTRTSYNLLKYFNIKKQLLSNHKFNESTAKNKILEELKAGKNVGIISDRGTPAISDPGYIAIKYIIDNGFNVVCLPGANAIIPSFVMSGFDTSHFIFYGFLNSKQTKQIKELEILKTNEYPIIFYESPHRIKNTLINIKMIFGDRKMVLARELTKIHEEIIRDNISNIILIADELKGEFVIVVDGYEKEILDYQNIDVLEHINNYINLGYTEKDAIKQVAKDRKINKNEIYKEYHNK